MASKSPPRALQEPSDCPPGPHLDSQGPSETQFGLAGAERNALCTKTAQIDPKFSWEPLGPFCLPCGRLWACPSALQALFGGTMIQTWLPRALQEPSKCPPDLHLDSQGPSETHFGLAGAERNALSPKTVQIDSRCSPSALQVSPSDLQMDPKCLQVPSICPPRCPWRTLGRSLWLPWALLGCSWALLGRSEACWGNKNDQRS